MGIIKKWGKWMRKSKKIDENEILSKNQISKYQQFKKLKRLIFNFHNPEIPSSNLGLDTKSS